MYVCVCLTVRERERENGIITSQVNKGKQLGHKRLTWPTDFNALVCLNEIPSTISASHTHGHTHIDMYTLIMVVSLQPSGSPDRCGSHTQTHRDKHSQTHTLSRTHKPGPTGHFPYPGTAQWALCTPSLLPTPGLTINPPPASSTSLFKWEIMQMSSHHRGTPHISDVHSVKSIVCLWEHVWESAHECFYSLRDGCSLNTQSTSQVFEPYKNISSVSHKLQCFIVAFHVLP